MIGVAYIQAVSSTLYRCIKSRKNTASVLNSKPIPMANTKHSITTNGNRKNVSVGHTPEKIITINTATMESSRFTQANRHFSNGNIYLGM